MDKKPYDPSDIERKLYQEWEDSGIFEPGDGSDSYSLAIPPPNVTGTLHMGHGFQNAIMDCLIRYYRMSGKNTLWQVGTDHAGIATEMVVERRLNANGKSKNDIGREAFEKEVWNWKKYSGNKITSQLRRLGSSLDWSTERFTLDDDYQHAVLSAFIQLFEEGLIYQGKRLVNWDPALETSLSDLEVVNKDLTIKIWEIKYQLEGADEFVTVATTRPETLMGDMALAVNPDDKRFAHLVGKNAEIPLCNRVIPIVADDYVDSEFGTGVVKITPGHDFNDYEVGVRNKLEILNIFTDDGKINKNAPSEFVGLDRFQARKKILSNLTEKQLLVKEENIKNKVPYGDRSNSIIEPYLTEQWFVDAKKLSVKAKKIVKSNKTKFYPGNWSKTYFQWMNNIEPWCISRQLWWGHQIPAWYGPDKKIFVGKTESEAKKIAKKYYKKDVKLFRDPDVLDTWFSSGLWAFATLGWPAKNDYVKKFYPTSVLVTGFDIIFFWVTRMIMAGLEFNGRSYNPEQAIPEKEIPERIPFKHVYFTGIIRDAEGKKMSKSLGNSPDPLDLIDKYGADGLRHGIMSIAPKGQDIRFSEERIEQGRNFCNKLWNVSRFRLLSGELVNNSTIDLITWRINSKQINK